MSIKVNKFQLHNQKIPNGIVPPPLIITVTYMENGAYQITTNRPTNPLELGSICSNIQNSQWEALTKQLQTGLSNPRVDRYQKHAFDGEDTSRGCGICGRRFDDTEIHPERVVESSVS